MLVLGVVPPPSVLPQMQSRPFDGQDVEFGIHVRVVRQSEEHLALLLPPRVSISPNRVNDPEKVGIHHGTVGRELGRINISIWTRVRIGKFGSAASIESQVSTARQELVYLFETSARSPRSLWNWGRRDGKIRTLNVILPCAAAPPDLRIQLEID